jgi:hypothetical protein
MMKKEEETGLWCGWLVERVKKEKRIIIFRDMCCYLIYGENYFCSR